MKNLFILSLGLLFFTSCKENPILIPDLQSGNRNILAEELTGVRCQNCPEGAAELVRQDSIWGKNLVVISIHAADVYSFPYTGDKASKYDFRHDDAEKLITYIGEYSGFPTASINRHTFAPNPSPFLTSTSSWGGFIAQELAKPAEANIAVDLTYDETNRKANINVNIAPEANLFGEVRLTIMVTEDKIIDTQLVGPDLVKDYEHRHVLRDIITQASGNVLTESFTVGTAIQKNFEYTIPADWHAENCSIVALVHKNNGPEKDVIQVVEAHLHE